MQPPVMSPNEAGASRARLDRHPVYAMLRSIDELRLFMAQHVYAVWDFMSLVKSLQAAVAPTRVPWVPVGDLAVRRFVNSIVLEEETDLASPTGDGYLSHFELYCGAMREIGADTGPVERFLELVVRRGIDAALEEGDIPEPARQFMGATFGFISTGKAHVVAAALAHGREHVIPGMFRGLLRELGVGADEAPMFHFYLERHIHLDEDEHGPMSLRLTDSLCAGDPRRIAEARLAAQAAVAARLRFWDGVAASLEAARRADAAPETICARVPLPARAYPCAASEASSCSTGIGRPNR